MLSANMASSSVKSVCCYGHRIAARQRCLREKNRPRFHAAVWNFPDTRGVRFDYFAGSVGLGAGGLTAPVPPGFAAAGLVAPAGAAGAGTPDWTLYASTTGRVMSTASPHHSTLLCGQGCEVSTIIP